MTAAEQWIDEQSDVVEIDGELVHAAVTVDLDVDSTVTIRRLASNPARAQGLAIDADEPFLVNDSTLTRAVLWDHRAPDEVVLTARAGRLTFWNTWEHDGAVHAWIGAAGIRLDEDRSAEGVTRLLASDGEGTLSVDLDIEIHIGAG